MRRRVKRTSRKTKKRSTEVVGANTRSVLSIRCALVAHNLAAWAKLMYVCVYVLYVSVQCCIFLDNSSYDVFERAWQVYKQKGEEYRIWGGDGWLWHSATRVYRYEPQDQCGLRAVAKKILVGWFIEHKHTVAR